MKKIAIIIMTALIIINLGLFSTISLTKQNMQNQIDTLQSQIYRLNSEISTIQTPPVPSDNIILSSYLIRKFDIENKAIIYDISVSLNELTEDSVLELKVNDDEIFLMENISENKFKYSYSKKFIPTKEFIAPNFSLVLTQDGIKKYEDDFISSYIDPNLTFSWHRAPDVGLGKEKLVFKNDSIVYTDRFLNVDTNVNSYIDDGHLLEFTVAKHVVLINDDEVYSKNINETSNYSFSLRIELEDKISIKDGDYFSDYVEIADSFGYKYHFYLTQGKVYNKTFNYLEEPNFSVQVFDQDAKLLTEY